MFRSAEGSANETNYVFLIARWNGINPFRPAALFLGASPFFIYYLAIRWIGVLALSRMECQCTHCTQTSTLLSRVLIKIFIGVDDKKSDECPIFLTKLIDHLVLTSDSYHSMTDRLTTECVAGLQLFSNYFVFAYCIFIHLHSLMKLWVK